jgi:hypothetical protein
MMYAYALIRTRAKNATFRRAASASAADRGFRGPLRLGITIAGGRIGTIGASQRYGEPDRDSDDEERNYDLPVHGRDSTSKCLAMR